jgi:SAM-dependent methyltransferase
VKVYFDLTTYLKHNAIMPLRKRLVREMLGDLRGLRILDAGCGNGFISMSFLKENYVTFLDISTGMLNATAKGVPIAYSSRADMIQGSLLDTRFPTQFDIVLCLGVLAYTETPERVIRRVAQLLKPGGRCILQITDAATLMGRGLHQYVRWRQRIGVCRNHITLTRTTRQQILLAAFDCGLALIREERYPAIFPGVRHLGQAVCSSYLEWGHGRQLGCELLMELARELRNV